MSRVLLLLVVAFGALETVSGQRVLEEVENSAELSLSEIELPTSATGSVAFRTCATCRSSNHRVTAATTYLVDGSAVALEDLVRIAEQIRAVRGADERAFVGVYYDRGTGNVARIALHRPAR